MPDKVIKPGRTDEYQDMRGVAMMLGDVAIETPKGVVNAVDAPGYSTMVIDHGDPDFTRVGLLLYSPGEGRNGTGMICQMTATEARTIAASLLRLASTIDPGKPN